MGGLIGDTPPADAAPCPARAAARIAAIVEATPRYRADPAASAAAAALWGGGCNGCGVFEGAESERIAGAGDACYADVLLARSPNGLWAIGVEAGWGTGGFGRAPSIWGEPFATRGEARRAAVRTLAEGLGRPGGDRKRAELLRRVKDADRQRGLFD